MSQTSPAPASRLAVATGTLDSPAGPAALITGTLVGTTTGDTACFRIAEDPHHAPIVWPKGYYALPSPLRVLNASGMTVATAGHNVRFQGGAADLPAKQTILGCGPADEVIGVVG